jgi:hypothetical protein
MTDGRAQKSAADHEKMTLHSRLKAGSLGAPARSAHSVAPMFAQSVSFGGQEPRMRIMLGEEQR